MEAKSEVRNKSLMSVISAKFRRDGLRRKWRSLTSQRKIDEIERAWEEAQNSLAVKLMKPVKNPSEKAEESVWVVEMEVGSGNATVKKTNKETTAEPVKVAAKPKVGSQTNAAARKETRDDDAKELAKEAAKVKKEPSKEVVKDAAKAAPPSRIVRPEGRKHKPDINAEKVEALVEETGKMREDLDKVQKDVGDLKTAVDILMQKNSRLPRRQFP